MARGITEDDVWQAADALIQEGQRPTIERIRQRLGSGSPNTVSPMLERWYQGLGRRLRPGSSVPDPAGQGGGDALLLPMPDVPLPVLEAAEALWARMQESLHPLYAQRLADALRSHEEARARAEELAREAQQQRELLQMRNEQAQAEAAALRQALESAQAAHRSVLTHRDQCLAELDRLRIHIRQMDDSAQRIQLEAQTERARQDERMTQESRRAALLLDQERQARLALERQVTKLREAHAAQFQVHQDSQVQLQEALRLAEADTLKWQARHSELDRSLQRLGREPHESMEGQPVTRRKVKVPRR